MQAQQKVLDWIALMEQSGVDVSKYLEVENLHCATTWNNFQPHTYDWPGCGREFYPIMVGDKVLPCWRFSVDESSPIRELFMEFPYVCTHGLPEYYYTNFPQNHEDQHQAWKDVENMLWDENDWIIRPPLAGHEYGHRLVHSCTNEERAKLKESLQLAHSLMESRFNRRQMKKLRKARCADKEFTPRKPMPGTWYDEYDL